MAMTCQFFGANQIDIRHGIVLARNSVWRASIFDRFAEKKGRAALYTSGSGRPKIPRCQSQIAKFNSVFK